MSAPPDPLRDLLLDALAPLGPIAARRFFSGTGFTYDGTFFAMIILSTVYMRVDDGNRPRYEAAGSRPFSYATRKGRVTVGAFYTLPEALLDDEEELRVWARQAIAAALAAKKPKARKKAAARKEPASPEPSNPKSAAPSRSGRGPRAPSRGSNRRNSRSP
jgi:DNA transformation protein